MFSRLGWRMELRRLGIKLGLVKKPLFDDYHQHQIDTAIGRRLMVLGSHLTYLPITPAIQDDPGISALNRIVRQYVRTASDPIPDVDMQRAIVEQLEAHDLLSVFISERPFTYHFYADEQIRKQQALWEALEPVDDLHEAQIAKDPTLAAEAITRRIAQLR